MEAQLRAANGEPSPVEPVADLASLRLELRTPLNTVLGFAQLLKASPSGATPAVEEILGAATRLAQLLEEPAAPTINVTGLSAPRGGAVTTERAASGDRTVLCIEDNSANCKLIEVILSERSNIKLHFAKTGSEGVGLAREHAPDLVLLDLNLPDMHGSEVLHFLRADKQTAGVPVVVISADATASQIERVLSQGARNYLTKPFDVERFLFTVDEALSERAVNGHS